MVLDCLDPDGLSAFWCGALGYRNVGTDGPYVMLSPAEGDGPVLLLQRVPEPKVVKNRMHLDVRTTDLPGEVARLEGLGARRLVDDPIQESGCRWVVMADPEGNELCVCHEGC